jgi:hypothetical protein
MIFEREAMKQNDLMTKRMSIVILVLCVGVAAADEFEIARSTIDGGVVMRSTGGAFELSGTIGQPDAGKITSGDGEFELTGGFWFEEPPDDCNSDGWIDLVDYDDFGECLSGPDGGLPFPPCNCFDLDSDNDVDLSDIRWFQQAFNGA